MGRLPLLGTMEPTGEALAQGTEGPGDLPSRLWAAVSCWSMASMFLVAWWWPRAIDHGRWVKLGVGMLFVEFLVIQSGALLISLSALKDSAARRRALLRLGCLYGVFGIAVVLAFRSWEVLASFLVVMSGRFWSAWNAREDEGTELFKRRVAASTVLFMVLVFLSAVVPVPHGGVTPQLLQEVWPTQGTGLWQRHPETALATGAVYFLLLGLVELRTVGPRSAG